MNITVRTHDVDITQALKDYAEKKIQKLEKYFENIQKISVELNINHASAADKRQVVKATVMASGAMMRAEETSADMYASIDGLYEKLEPQLKKYKDKLKEHHKNGGKRREIMPSLASVASSNGNSNAKHYPEDRLYIKKPMGPEDAATLLADSPQRFLVFRNIETEAINVIYPLGNNSFGLIET